MEEAGRDAAKAGMGTTVVAATVIGDHLHVATVGDSRLYLINHEAIRADHKGSFSGRRDGPFRERWIKRMRKIIRIRTSSHGRWALFPSCPWIFFEVELKPGDTVLMCSDGLTNMIEDEEIKKIVLGQRDIVEKAEKLIDTANGNGGKDNITVVLIEPFSDEVKEC